jgi:type I restriction enzyme S subunit
MQLSNVDKNTVEGEEPVRLCNYIDVYNKDLITADLELMGATATPAEVRKFMLRDGDVLITKDSESWEDIAVPAYVVGDHEGILCGYHLAQVRSNPSYVDGKYLFYSFYAMGVNDQFRVAATGITRYSLGKYWLDNGLFPVPSIDEQRAIATLLDRETTRIDLLIEKKQRQIELLQEKRVAIISHTVTKGLNPNAEMKDSSVEWLGMIPEHWEVKRLKFLFKNLDFRRVPLSAEERSYMEKRHPYYGASGIIDSVKDYIFDEPLILVAEDGANLLSRSTPLAFIAEGKYWVNNHAHILKPIAGPLKYWEGVLQTYDYTPLITGAAQPKLTAENLDVISLPAPPEEEQHDIATFLDHETAGIDSLIEKVNKSIALVREYRMAIISAAVTGKIDIRKTAGTGS